MFDRKYFELAMKRIRSISTLLHQPHPFIFTPYSIIIPGGVTFLIITLLAPLQYQEMNGLERSLNGALIGFLVSATILLTVKGLRKMAPQFMDEEEWTIGREILLYFIIVLLIIGGIFCSFYRLYSGSTSTGHFFITTVGFTGILSFFPILILVLFEQYTYQKKQLRQAQQLTSLLKAENHYLKSEKVSQVLLKAENGKVELQLHPAELFCLKSDSNYIEVFYSLEGSWAKKLIRNRLKHMEGALPEDRFFRCHNRFIVNREQIVRVEGNARNLSLVLKGVDFKIPVSRAKAKSISAFLEQA